MSDLQTLQSAFPRSVTSYSLTEFLDTFNLPQLVRVYEGHFDHVEHNTVCANDIYNLQAVNRVETVLLENFSGVETRIPLDNQCSVERVPDEFVGRLLTIEDLTKIHSLVKFVRVIETDLNFQCLIRQGEKLKVKKDNSRGNFVAFRKTGNEKTVLKLPTNCEAKFQVLSDGEELPLNKFVKKVKLPVHVRFLTDSINDIENEQREQKHRQPPIGIDFQPSGVVKVKGVFSDSFVTATTDFQGNISTVFFPKSLAIRVVPTKQTTQPKDALKFTSSQGNESSTRKESGTDEDPYEDMSGVVKNMEETAGLKTSSAGSKMTSNVKVMLSNLIRQETLPNTYSSVPTKVTRSYSTTNSNYRNVYCGLQQPRKRPVLLQRTRSHLELRAELSAKEDNLYEEINPRRKSDDIIKLNKATIQRRQNEPSTDQQSIESAQTPKNEEGMVSFENLRKSPSFEILCSEKVSSNNSVSKAGNETPGISLINRPDHHNQFMRTALSRSEKAFCIPVALEQSSFYLAQSARVREDEQEPPFREGSAVSLQTKVETAPEHLTSSSFGNSQDILNISDREGIVEPVELNNKTETGAAKSSRIPEENPKPKDTTPSTVIKASSALRNQSQRSRPLIPLRNDQVVQSSRPEIPPKGNSLTEQITGSKIPPHVPPRKERSSIFKSSLTPMEGASVTKPASHETTKLDDKTDPSNSTVSSHMGEDASGTPADLNIHATTVFDTELQQRGPVTATVAKEKPSEAFPAQNEDSKSDGFVIPADLSILRVSEVLKCLAALNMQNFEDVFRAGQVDGSMLVCLDEEALESFGMDRFHRLKLLKVIKDGWRPQH